MSYLLLIKDFYHLDFPLFGIIIIKLYQKEEFVYSHQLMV
jgi:hypothetical protein